MTKNETQRYVVCVRAEDAFDIEVGKVYAVLPAERGDGPTDLRVEDESGEAYLYPTAWFVDVDVPEASARALRAAWKSRSSAAG